MYSSEWLYLNWAVLTRKKKYLHMVLWISNKTKSPKEVHQKWAYPNPLPSTRSTRWTHSCSALRNDFNGRSLLSISTISSSETKLSSSIPIVTALPIELSQNVTGYTFLPRYNACVECLVQLGSSNTLEWVSIRARCVSTLSASWISASVGKCEIVSRAKEDSIFSISWGV